MSMTLQKNNLLYAVCTDIPMTKYLFSHGYTYIIILYISVYYIIIYICDYMWPQLTQITIHYHVASAIDNIYHIINL